EPAGGIGADLIAPVPVARLDAVESGMEVRAPEIPGRAVDLIEEIGAEDWLVDHQPLRRRARAAPRLVGEQPHLDPGAALGRLHRLAPRPHEDRHLPEDERLLPRSDPPT